MLVYKHGEWQLLLDTYTVTTNTGNSSSSTTYTRMRAPFINKDDLQFKIYRSGLFSPLGKLFGMQDIEIGDPLFDDQFIIKGNNPSKIGMLLYDPKLRNLIQNQPRIHLEIKDDEGWFGKSFPEGVDELYFRCVGVMKETYLLKALFDMFTTTLERLVQIDSAYEDDPGISLK